jgi:hypothetical protein
MTIPKRLAALDADDDSEAISRPGCESAPGRDPDP